jgi:hypothetical protein
MNDQIIMLGPRRDAPKNESLRKDDKRPAASRFSNEPRRSSRASNHIQPMALPIALEAQNSPCRSLNRDSAR